MLQKRMGAWFSSEFHVLSVLSPARACAFAFWVGAFHPSGYLTPTQAARYCEAAAESYGKPARCY
jgi:hypothetical protein